MRIVFAYYIATPFLLAVLTILYLAWEGSEGITVWIAPFLLILSFIWVFSPQINWWWYKSNPPLLEPEVAQAIYRFTPFAKRLSKEELQLFFARVALTRLATDWTAKDLPEEVVPPDMQTAVAVQSVICTWNKEQFLIKDFEKVVLMPGPFLSPEHPSFHSAERYLPENVILLNAAAVMNAFLQPTNQFNLALYIYSKITLESAPNITLPPSLNTAFLSKMEAISGWNEDYLKTVLGQDDVDRGAVLLCHYFTFYEAFKQNMPEWTALMDQLFFQKST
jgi:hypothetical protein